MKSPLGILGIVATLLITGPAHALEFSVNSIEEAEGFALATVKFINDDAPEGYRVIAFNCTWLKNGFGVVHAADSIIDLQFQDTSFVEVRARLRGKKFDNAVCHVSTAIKN